ncbi:MAG TPA: hypothetical protein VD833_08230 [Vicinamibacterales bacterium]|nr:hypothetical protein [Vicinamibacterales bacterium]
MFRWYYEGQRTVQVGTVDDVCRWLAECQYLSDDELFNETDFWQHPRTFENLCKGDCEDHALWAWTKLVEFGHQAELFVGQLFEGASRYGGQPSPGSRAKVGGRQEARTPDLRVANEPSARPHLVKRARRKRR